jgi:chromosome segregation ATPase
LLRDSIRKESPASADTDLKAVNSLWSELEKLYEAAQEAKTALPTFLERQKDNMSLYHNSVVNEGFQETHEELAAQQKKVNIQHALILEHQQAFQNYKADMEPKLKEINDLQERVSRLTLDKGLLRTELDNIRQELVAAQSKQDEEGRKADAVQNELDQLVCRVW